MAVGINYPTPEEKPAESVCGEADRLVSGDRNAYYGHALDDFCKTALFWSTILGIQISPEQVAMCMEAVKMSREINRHKRDNLVDLCGYAKCHELVIAEKERRFRCGWTFNAATARWTPPEPNKQLITKDQVGGALSNPHDEVYYGKPRQ